MVQLKLKNEKATCDSLKQIEASQFNQRAYLYYGALAEYYIFNNDIEKALLKLDQALKEVQNATEEKYLLKKKNAISQK